MIYEFDTANEQYTGRTLQVREGQLGLHHRRRNNATNIFVTGDMTHVADDRYIIIERDDFQGPPTARIRRGRRSCISST